MECSPTTGKEELLSYVEKHQKDLIDLLDRLIRAKTVNPPGNEIEAAKIVEEEFNKLDIPYEVYEKSEGRTNIIGKIGNKPPHLMIIAHLDVVPEGEGWSYSPFKTTIKDNKIYGRGTVDDKGPLAAALMAVRAIKELDVEIDGTLSIAGVADEERGSLYGVRYLLEEKRINPDYVLVAEATNGNIEIAEKGAVGTKLISKGKQAHGSMPEQGINAIVKLTKILARLNDFEFTYKQDPLLGKPTLNVGIIKGGVAVNVVPSSCEAHLDVRIIPGQNEKTVKRDLEKFIETVRIEENDEEINVIVEVSRSIPATSMSENEPIVKLLSDIIIDVAGFRPKCFGIGGITVAKFFLLSGIPAPVFSMGDEKRCHMVDEYITIDELTTLAKVFTIMQTRLDYLNK